MKVYKRTGGGAAFVRKEPYEYEGTKYEADLKNGDVVKVLDSGNIEPGQWGEQTNFKIKTRNGEKRVAFNQKTQNVLIEEFGDQTEEWVNKDVQVILKKDTIAGKKVIIPYFVIEGWALDEYGELIKSGVKKDADSVEIDSQDVPF